MNGSMLHSIQQLSGDVPDPMPNIVFFGSLIAPDGSAIYELYIRPIMDCQLLPYTVFRHDCSDHMPINALIQHRLQKAHELLYDAAMTLQEISDTCGFHLVNYFSRQFRKRYGYAPSHVRELRK